MTESKSLVHLLREGYEVAINHLKQLCLKGPVSQDLLLAVCSMADGPTPADIAQDLYAMHNYNRTAAAAGSIAIKATQAGSQVLQQFDRRCGADTT